MDMDESKVEKWMNRYENGVIYNLGKTYIHSLTISEPLVLSGEDPDTFLHSLLDVRLTYGPIGGSPQPRRKIAFLYENISPENVIPAHGAIGANH